MSFPWQAFLAYLLILCSQEISQHFYLKYNPYSKFTSPPNNVIWNCFVCPLIQNGNKDHIAFSCHTSWALFNLELFLSLLFCFGFSWPLMFFMSSGQFCRISFHLEVFDHSFRIRCKGMSFSVHLIGSNMMSVCPINDDDKFNHLVKVALVRFQHCCCCLVAKSCLTLCDPMDCSPPGFLALHCLLELAQTHIHWVDDAIHSTL